MERKKGLERLTTKSANSTRNQHHIITHFIVKDILVHSKAYARGDLLDIGCGNKPYQYIFDDIVNTYIGCDIVQSSENVVDVICPATKLKFDANTFDTVFCTQVMEHVADHQTVISEMKRVLKPGGIGIITVPFNWELHEEPYDFFRFSKHGLKHLFEAQHFEIVELKANGGKWAAIFQLFLNTLYSTRRYKTFWSKSIKLLFVHFRFVVVYNKFAIWLDKKFRDEIFTLNYIIVVKNL